MSSIDLRNVSFQYELLGSEARSLRRALIGRVTGGRVGLSPKGRTVINALRDITLSVSAGGRLGLLGRNGAGKSTLLRVIAGIFEPTMGTRSVDGTIGSLLNLGLGMHDSLTGWENIQVAGLTMGLSQDEINERRQAISDFAELGDFMEMRVGSYSAGMRTRLAFSISTAINPDVLVIDEVFGAGDADFARKAEARMESLISNSKVLVFSSHSEGLLQRFCNSLAILKDGQLVFHGGVADGLKQYHDRFI